MNYNPMLPYTQLQWLPGADLADTTHLRPRNNVQPEWHVAVRLRNTIGVNYVVIGAVLMIELAVGSTAKCYPHQEAAAYSGKIIRPQ